LIPDFSPKQEVACVTLNSQVDYEAVRKLTTDKPMIMLVSAEWDEPSSHLMRMFVEMPQSRPHCKFAKIDADEGTALVDMFEVDAVPALIVVHPHKTKPDVHQSNVTPEFMNAEIAK